MGIKRVLHVVGSINAGGMETMIMNYYRNIDRTKIQFDFLIFTEGKGFYEDEIISLGGKIYKVTPRRRNVVKNYLELKKFFKANKYDVVHIHQGVTTLLPLKFAKKYGISKRIVHNHGINRKIKKVLKPYIEIYVKPKIKKLATHYFACSENILDHLYSKDIIQNKKYFICKNAIDIEKFKYQDKIRKEKRESLKIDDKIVLGHVGTFTVPKNHEFLIDIFSKLYEKNNKYILLLIGEGPLEDTIKAKVEELNLTGSVMFLGRREDVNELMMAMDILLFPSLYEGLPVTLIEAQYAGVDVIASNNITKEVKISDKIKFLNLDITHWITEILDFVSGHTHNIQILNGEFNILKAVNNLEKIYLEGE